MPIVGKQQLDDAKHAGENAKHAADNAQHAGQRAIDNPLVVAFARLGYAIKGVVYITIGILAAGIALGRGGASADQRNALLALYYGPLGRLLLPILVLGLFGYALWNFADALLDADHEGDGAKALLERVGCAAIGVSYAGLGIAALQLALGAGNGGASSDAKTQDWTARLLGLPLGVPLVVIAGLVALGLGGYQIYRAVTEGFEDRLALGSVDPRMRRAVELAGRLGYSALGVFFALVGIFLIIAALHHDPGEARGLGGALQVLVSRPYGSILLGLVALGLLCFGVFSLVQARFRRIQPA